MWRDGHLSGFRKRCYFLQLEHASAVLHVGHCDINCVRRDIGKELAYTVSAFAACCGHARCFIDCRQVMQVPCRDDFFQPEKPQGFHPLHQVQPAFEIHVAVHVRSEEHTSELQSHV